jgi:hypothetical protein
VKQVTSNSTRRMPRLRAGDVVEVLSAREILATLDDKGELENLPFMPEMLRYCGQRMTVHKVAHKTCEIITGEGGLHWMNNAVHLTGARCNGEFHGGCQTACSFYWKEAWVRRVSPEGRDVDRNVSLADDAKVDVSVIERAAKKEPDADGSERFSCQATEILRATSGHIRFWDVDQYVADLRTRNVGLFGVIRAILFRLFNVYQIASRRVFPPWLLIKEGLPWGFVKGTAKGRTPLEYLDLQVGEVVRIRSKDEIASTLSAKRLNRGLGFEEEQARYCGKTARVSLRVERCIDEKSGKMLTMKNPCIVLEGIVCRGVYHGNCPRQYVPFWRESWLERVNSPGKQTAASGKS